MRKTRLADCDPHWVIYAGKEGDSPDGIYFECPEGHEDCHHVIPFTPALDGSTRPTQQGRGWRRVSGDTFDTLTLTPSIRRNSKYSSREEALADPKILPEYVTESMWCKLHIFVENGQIKFCGDSK